MSILNETAAVYTLIAEADDDDLCILADYVTDRGEGRLSLSNDVCKLLVQCRDNVSFGASARRILADEILKFGGNTLTNFYREMRTSMGLGSLLDNILPDATPTIGYDEIVRDVASHMKVSSGKHDRVEDIEASIIRHLMGESLKKMDSETAGKVTKDLGGNFSVAAPATAAATLAVGGVAGFATYRIAMIVANSVARTFTGRGLELAANAAVTRTLGMVLGPIGWAVTGLWTLADLSSPAYRVTVPCVVQLAYMRLKMVNKYKITVCEPCGAFIDRHGRFCPSCGQANEVTA